MFEYNMPKKLAFDLAAVERYPFLRMRAADGAVDLESEWPMMLLEIPDGWYPLFFQMCSDIKAVLEKEGVEALENFYFIQVKEKYNQLRCYHTGSKEIDDIITKYSYISRYVCTKCGKPAVFETNGYLASFCYDCWKDLARHEAGEWLEFSNTFVVSGYSKGQVYKNEISVKDGWSRYLSSFGGID